ncbi:hypothetical protein ScPMuIL_013413 [Solemya velum]
MKLHKLECNDCLFRFTLAVCFLVCHYGCDLYATALSSSCQDACSDWVNSLHENQAGIVSVTGSLIQSEKQGCAQGCSYALEDYAHSVREMLGPLPRPTVSRESKGNYSVVLEWTGIIHPNVTHYLQMKVIDTNSDWQILNSTNLQKNGEIKVIGLHPYVTYKFKLILVITPFHILETDETVPITTLAYGAPTSSPTITSVSAPSPSVISVSWEAPLYPNGPLLGYRINLTPFGHPSLPPVTKEISSNLMSWTFGQLQSSQLYMITVSAWNSDGEGPVDTHNITTPNPGNLSDDQIPYLILAADNMVLQQNLLKQMEEPDRLLKQKSNTLITGVAVHVAKQIVLVSDSDGEVHRISLDTGDIIRNFFPSLMQPSGLTIDWLTDKVYIIDGNKIYQCALDRSQCFVAVGPIPDTPSDIKVDPINGFLYYTKSGQGQGLWRVDIGEIRLYNLATPQLIVALELFTFALDLDNIQIFFPNNSQNTMMSSFLDGSGLMDIRNGRVVKPNFHHVTSMISYDCKFIWTNGSKVMSEDFDKTFYHNPLLFFEEHFKGLNVYHSSAQPIPIPYTPPSDIQALFTVSKVFISWYKPEKLQYQGRGSWDNWEYEVSLVKEGDSRSEWKHKLKELYLDVTNLESDTNFEVKVRAMSIAGKGPWSKLFKGRTLKEEPIPATLIYAAAAFTYGTGEIIEMDLDSQIQNTLTKLSIQNPEVIDIDWYKNQVLWASGEGSIYIHNREQARSQVKLEQVYGAACLAVDWLGEKVYWSVPQERVIQRSDFGGLSVELIYQAMARDMAIDAVVGRLYWVTSNTVETTYLNGDDHLEYFAIRFFSGKQVISLTLDFELGKIMWFVKCFGSEQLFMADLMLSEGDTGVVNTVEQLGSFHSISEYSRLHYYSNHLFWSGSDNDISMGDLYCNYSSKAIQDDVMAFTVYQPALKPYPVGQNEATLKIIPEAVLSSSVQTVGNWSQFNITWQAVTAVNHGKVFYEISLKTPFKTQSLVTDNTSQEVIEIDPYTLILLSVRAFTYWGYGPSTPVTIRSPMAAPTKPQTPRVYVTQHRDATTSEHSLAADFRWSNPQTLNGILMQNRIHYYHHFDDSEPQEPQVEVVSGAARHFIYGALQHNTTYYFQVQACTPVGCGEMSDLVSARADAVNPVPKLLIASKSGIIIEDADSIGNSTVAIGSSPASAVSFLAQDNRILWMKTNNILMVSSSDIKQLQKLNGTCRDVALDWVSRKLYIVERFPHKSVIQSYFLDTKSYVSLFERENDIQNIIIDPYTSTLFWTETDSRSQAIILYHSQTNGEYVSRLLTNHRLRRSGSSSCNCPSIVQPSSAIAMKYSKAGETEIFFVNLVNYSIMVSDTFGCKCQTVLATNEDQQYGLPPDHLTVDHLNVYWYNKSEEILYVLDRASQTVSLTPMSGVTDIMAYGTHLQPLPDSMCLDPGTNNGTVTYVDGTNSSITVRLNKVTWPAECRGISQPSTKYNVYYRKVSASGTENNCGVSGDSCMMEASYKHELTIGKLDAYTEYVFQAAVSNYYTEYLAEALGEPVILRTKEGVPSPVEIVHTTVQTLNEVRLFWHSPLKPNGPIENITYIVKWWTTTADGFHLEGQTNPGEVEPIKSMMSATISNLMPNHLYRLKVLSYESKGVYFSESREVLARTFQEPGPIVLRDVTDTTIDVFWQSPSDNSISRHMFLFICFIFFHVKGEYMEWEQSMPDRTDNYTGYNETFFDRKPNTDYSFRVRVVFRDSLTPYDWPPENRYTFRTLSNVPGRPDAPSVYELKSGGYDVVWSEPDDHGAAILHYILQCKQLYMKNWTLVYNGTDTHWILEETELEQGKDYVFRIAAKNVNGMGLYSKNSSLFYLPKMLSDKKDSIVTAVAVPVAFVVILLIIFLVVLFVIKRRHSEKRKPTHFIAVARGPDLELATLRELPHTTVQQSNTLYAINIIPTDENIAELPHVRRDQLILANFLGSGAFGEVFEGVAQNIRSDEPDTPVAVKTLRKSASENEKEEFLKEALLMSNFKHEHILQLLGVCLDNDPQFIILELMGGGDLLTFLRNCRQSNVNSPNLNPPDLVKICVHVARGCEYLEDMHFVHRDLAARNCLVSSKDPAEMVVKIGDFGLARDIYKQDYYRKEGEGLLPVRWMSPESLVDGVFTTESDIWAFGVLMWEVVTFGQQPYPARTNIEVLHFVRSGGRLDRPESCPEELYQLMCKCWSYASEDRPAFSYFLQQLENFHQKCISMSEYMVPIRSSNREDVAGSTHQYLKNQKKKGRKSSSGPDSKKKERKQSSRIQRATSFDSPEPYDATDMEVTALSNLNTSGYLFPRNKEIPLYLELLPDNVDSRHSTDIPYQRTKPCLARQKMNSCGSSSDISKTDTTSYSSICSSCVQSSHRGTLENSHHIPYALIQGIHAENDIPFSNTVEIPPLNDDPHSPTLSDSFQPQLTGNYSRTRHTSVGDPIVSDFNTGRSCVAESKVSSKKRKKSTESNSAEACLSFRPSNSLKCKQATSSNSAEARLTFRNSKCENTNEIEMINALKRRSKSLQIDKPCLWTDYNFNSGYLSTTSSFQPICPKPNLISENAQNTMGMQFWANNNSSSGAYIKYPGNHDNRDRLYLDYLRSRSQVYPVSETVLQGYDIIQASLV